MAQYWIECSVSGVGRDFRGTLYQAIEEAKKFARIECAPVKVYDDRNTLVASVRRSVNTGVIYI